MTGIGAHSDRASADVLLTASVPAITKAALMFDFVLPVLQAAGYDVLRYAGNHVTTTDLRFAVIRPPRLDGNDSYADLLVITNSDAAGAASATLHCFAVNDLELTDNGGFSWATALAVRASVVAWETTGGAPGNEAAWPSGGAPDRDTVIVSNAASSLFDLWRLVFTLPDKFEAFVVASAYGFSVASITSTPARSYAGLWSRQFDPERLGRRIAVTGFGPGRPDGSLKWPIKLAAPSNTGLFAGYHLGVEREGQTIRIRFPEGVDLYPHDLSREICQQSDLWLASEPEDIQQTNPIVLLGTNQQDLGVRVGIPDESEPCGELSISAPRCAIRWVDEELYATTDNVTKGLHFHLYRGNATAVFTGSGDISSPQGLIQVAGQDFKALRVKIGAWVANKDNATTKAAPKTRVIGFATIGATQNDTLVLDDVPTSWGPGDTYEVYKAADHNDGFLRIGGHNLCVIQDDATPILFTDGVKTLCLNDYGGEALNKYEVGQNLVIHNNECAVVFDANLSGGTLPLPPLPGDWVEVTGASVSLGSRGRVLMAQFISGTTYRLVVNTTRGASGNATPYKVTPWTNTDTVTLTRGLYADETGEQRLVDSRVRTGAISGLTTGESVAGKSTGWIGRFRVLAIGTKDPLNNDYRTTLQIDFGQVGSVNPSLALFPGAAIGVRAKMASGRYSDFSSVSPVNCVPTLTGNPSTADPIARGQNVRQMKAEMRPGFWGAVAINPDEPNWQHKNLGAARVNLLTTTTGVGGNILYANDKVANFAHLLNVTSRGIRPSQMGDVSFDEGSGVGNAGRAVPWVALDKFGDTTVVGAYTQVNTIQWWLIGPGQNLVPPGVLDTLNPPPPVMIMPPPIQVVPQPIDVNIPAVLFTMT